MKKNIGMIISLLTAITLLAACEPNKKNEIRYTSVEDKDKIYQIDLPDYFQNIMDNKIAFIQRKMPGTPAESISLLYVSDQTDNSDILYGLITSSGIDPADGSDDAIKPDIDILIEITEARLKKLSSESSIKKSEHQPDQFVYAVRSKSGSANVYETCQMAFSQLSQILSVCMVVADTPESVARADKIIASFRLQNLAAPAANPSETAKP